VVQDNSWEVKKLNISFDHVLSDAVEIINQSFAIVALKCQKAVEELIEKLAMELKVAMSGVGAKNINELQKWHCIRNT